MQHAVRWCLLWAAAGLTAGLSAAPAAAQAPAATPPRGEIWAAWGATLPAGDGTVSLAYAPPLQLGGTVLESRAQQVLDVDAAAAHLFDLGVNVFLNRIAGLQVAFGASSAAVTGTNGPHDTFFRYIARQPPGYVPLEYTYEQSAPWKDTAGSLRRRTLAIGPVLRWRSQGRVGGTFGGGLNVEWLSGELESAGYTQFILGGHATLFPVTHRVIVGPAPGTRFMTPYAAGDVHVAVSRWLAFVGGVRATLGPRREMPIEVVRLVDPNENPWTPELADVGGRLNGQPLEIAGTTWRLTAGLKIFLR